MTENRVKSTMLYVQTIKPHFSESNLEIILVLKGSITIQKVERVVTVNEGEFTLINRYIVHSIQSEGAYILSAKIRLSEFRDIFDKMEYVEFMNNDELLDINRPLKNRLNKVVMDLLIRQYLYEKDLDKADRVEERKLNEQHLVHMLFSSYQLISHMKEEEEYPTGKLQDRYYWIVEYVMKHTNEKIMVEDILKELYMNATYFSQFMKKVGGVNFKDFVQYRKLIMIQGYMLDYSLCMTEIANLVGIYDMKSFYSLFKRYFKKAPKTWRAESWQLEDEYTRVCDEQVLEKFMDKYHIKERKETSSSKLYKHLLQMKQMEPLDLEGTEIILNPYCDMGDQFDPYYQVYNYFNELIDEIYKSKISLHLVYPYRYLREPEQKELFINTMKLSSLKLMGGKMKKLKVSFMVQTPEQLFEAKELRQIIDQEIGNLAINVAINIAL
ncbi:helix-turn-helix domain-containing protein [Niameybacter massiliensis]|uniref:Helix-turn-helix domain-containing protein n=1 Tax=Holtiella tumoricola TaxID=3018743 RepID=A0AA42J002_9FIRM|nr:helix-turn-helix domain-containing protein [Holtiella tumoricola]MDA3730696.1 helix-turn-helix domain-containing protein [Holtiella tumoricola]